MPLTERRRPNPDAKPPDGRGESASAQVMVPTRMKLRVRRRDAAAEDAAGGGGGEQPEEGERRRESSSRSSRRKNASSAPPPSATAAAPSSPPGSSSSSSAAAAASARAALASEEASPDSKCPICLDRFNNLAFLDRCLHRFCFPCILEWSYNKAECPLCKQPFASILHSVRAEDDFKEHALAVAPTRSNVAATVAMVAAMASAARSENQRRLMRRRRRSGDARDTAAARRRRRERGGRGGGERAGVWEWYLDSLPVPTHLQRSPTSSPHAPQEAEATRGGATPGERGVIFEGLMGPEGPEAPGEHATRHLAARLSARRRQQLQGGATRQPRQSEMLALRRAIYRGGVTVRGVAGVDGERPQRDITAENFRRDQAQLSRLRPWLGRELMVLYGWHGSLIDIVLRIIVARVARHGLEDTPTIAEELRPFLLASTDHFLHELVSFARSPLSMDDYDLQAVYEPPPAAALDASGSSSSSSSVIAISEGEEPEEEQRADAVQTGSCLSLASWDDETPGPSYSTAEPSCSFSPAPLEAANEEGGAKVAEEEGEEECLIVGYKKPIAERTPELVQLSSDSEEAEPKKEEEQMLEGTPPLAFLPTIPPSTSTACRDATPKEADGRCSPSWSGSQESVCTLSPLADGERRRRHGKRADGEVARERRRKKRRRREQRKSGTLHNPNRSLCPAVTRRRSRSPSDSSADSASDANWDFCYSQVSPLSSSPYSSPPLASPPPLSPTARGTHGSEKPGGKRKYKSRHLDDDKDPSWRPSGGGRDRKGRSSSRKRRERPGRDAHRREESSSRPSRDDRSPSVEIIYEGTVSPGAAPPPAHKRRRRRRRIIDASSSPVIITLDSDSCHDDGRSSSSGSGSSPLSSQQTVDFSDLQPLPLMHSAGVGGAMDADIGELPVDILDRGSDGSDVEPASPVAVGNLQSSRDAGDAAMSDRHLAATVLSQLQGGVPPSPGPAPSPAGQPAPARPLPEEQPGDTTAFDLPSFCSSFPQPLQQLTNVPQPRPLQPHAITTPPPLKQEDAISRCLSPVSPADPADPRLSVPPISMLSNGVRGALAAAGGAGRPLAPFDALLTATQTASSADAATSAGQSCLGPSPSPGPSPSLSTTDTPLSPLSDSTSPVAASGLRRPATPSGSGVFSGVDQRPGTCPASSHTDSGDGHLGTARPPPPRQSEHGEPARATPPSSGAVRFNHAGLHSRPDAPSKVPDNHVTSSSRLAAGAAAHWTTHTHTAT